MNVFQWHALYHVNCFVDLMMCSSILFMLNHKLGCWGRSGDSLCAIICFINRLRQYCIILYVITVYLIKSEDE